MSSEKSFAWRAEDAKGQRYSGETIAESQDEVIELLLLRGLKPIDLDQWLPPETRISPHDQSNTGFPKNNRIGDIIFGLSLLLVLACIACAIFVSWKFCYIAAIFAGIFLAFCPDRKDGETAAIAAQKPVKQLGVNTVMASIGWSFLAVLIVVISSSIHRNILESRTQKESITHETEKTFQLSKTSKKGIILTIKDYGADDAAIKVKGSTINLAVQVPFGTSKEKARRICDNFVRQVMALSNDNSPKQEIGKGHFSYHVGAFTPDEKWLVQGYKGALSRKITW